MLRFYILFLQPHKIIIRGGEGKLSSKMERWDERERERETETNTCKYLLGNQRVVASINGSIRLTLSVHVNFQAISEICLRINKKTKRKMKKMKGQEGGQSEEELI